MNGKHYREHAAPLHEVGALLEARSVHTGRSAYNHLLALAQTHGIARRRVFLMLVGIFALGIGTIVRNTAGGMLLSPGSSSSSHR